MNVTARLKEGNRTMNTNPHIPGPGMWFDGTLGNEYNIARVIALALKVYPTLIKVWEPENAITEAILRGEPREDFTAEDWERWWWFEDRIATPLLERCAPDGFWIGWSREGDYGMWEAGGR